tara:strand:+ start:239 stop:487 length:249 start_codon:yes stop_codon:yes gene_type:complete
MRKLVLFVLGLILFLFPSAIQADDFTVMPQEEIAEAPALDPLTEAEINALLGEDPYIGETDWRGDKVSNKLFTAAKRIKNRN